MNETFLTKTICWLIGILAILLFAAWDSAMRDRKVRKVRDGLKKAAFDSAMLKISDTEQWDDVFLNVHEWRALEEWIERRKLIFVPIRVTDHVEGVLIQRRYVFRDGAQTVVRLWREDHGVYEHKGE